MKMSGIQVNVEELDNAIKKLQGLHLDKTIVAPTTIGGGKTINELENLAVVYKMLSTDFEELVANTITFLQNVKDSYVSSDAKAAEGIKQ